MAIVGNFSFIREEQLAGGACPRSVAHFEGLWARGCRAILSLTQKPLLQEFAEGAEAFASIVDTQGWSRLHVPIIDMTAPSCDQLTLCVEFIDREISQGHPVFVHCTAGIGRTGTVLVRFHSWYLIPRFFVSVNVSVSVWVWVCVGVSVGATADGMADSTAIAVDAIRTTHRSAVGKRHGAVLAHHACRQC